MSDMTRLTLLFDDWGVPYTVTQPNEAFYNVTIAPQEYTSPPEDFITVFGWEHLRTSFIFTVESETFQAIGLHDGFPPCTIVEYR